MAEKKKGHKTSLRGLGYNEVTIQFTQETIKSKSGTIKLLQDHSINLNSSG